MEENEIKFKDVTNEFIEEDFPKEDFLDEVDIFDKFIEESSPKKDPFDKVDVFNESLFDEIEEIEILKSE